MFGHHAQPTHPPWLGWGRLLRLGGEWRKREAESEEGREPDPPQGHLGEGWLAGV